jgi:hypothetical protein
MPDLTAEQVRQMAACIGIEIIEEDLADVTLRLNATLEHLASLDKIELDSSAILQVRGL